jgi:hypothetical protein
MWHDGDACRKRLRELKRNAHAIGGSWMIAGITHSSREPRNPG